MRALLPGASWCMYYGHMVITRGYPYFSAFQLSGLWKLVQLWFVSQLPHTGARLDLWMSSFNYRGSVSSWRMHVGFITVSPWPLSFIFNKKKENSSSVGWIKMWFPVQGKFKGLENVWAVTAPPFADTDKSCGDFTAIRQEQHPMMNTAALTKSSNLWNGYFYYQFPPQDKETESQRISSLSKVTELGRGQVVSDPGLLTEV